MGDISSSALIELAIDLTNSLNKKDRFDRLLRTVRSTIACEAVVLLQLQGPQLKPLAQIGLSRDSLGRRFSLEDHPRFFEICRSREPVRFASDSDLPDPYDGMLLSHEGNLPVHACMGLPLLVDGELLGILTLDSMTPNIFDEIPKRTLDIISAMSAATLKTAILLEQLEHLSQHSQQVVVELTHEALAKDGGELIGSSEAMAALKREIILVGPSDLTVLIEGETGVGKELVARTLHRQSARAKQALVYVNCAAIPENLIESELFGHVKGSFTGADKNRTGKFSLADQGTLFLDEIGELPLAAQSKLLRALQSQEIQPVGQDHIDHVDVRVIAATNRNLEEEVSEGRFRADLYHRLSVYPVQVLPLRERAGDVSELAGFFCEQMRRKLGLQQLILSPSVKDQLEHYDWPGNVRELEHVISRAALRAKGQQAYAIVEITASDIEILNLSHQRKLEPERVESQASSEERVEVGNLKLATEQFQRQLILQAIDSNNGNWAAAARHLELDRANLVRLAKRLGIQVDKKVVLK